MSGGRFAPPVFNQLRSAFWTPLRTGFLRIWAPLHVSKGGSWTPLTASLLDPQEPGRRAGVFQHGFGAVVSTPGTLTRLAMGSRLCDHDPKSREVGATEDAIAASASTTLADYPRLCELCFLNKKLWKSKHLGG